MTKTVVSTPRTWTSSNTIRIKSPTTRVSSASMSIDIEMPECRICGDPIGSGQIYMDADCTLKMKIDDPETCSEKCRIKYNRPLYKALTKEPNDE